MNVRNIGCKGARIRPRSSALSFLFASGTLGIMQRPRRGRVEGAMRAAAATIGRSNWLARQRLFGGASAWCGDVLCGVLAPGAAVGTKAGGVPEWPGYAPLMVAALAGKVGRGQLEAAREMASFGRATTYALIRWRAGQFTRRPFLPSSHRLLLLRNIFPTKHGEKGFPDFLHKVPTISLFVGSSEMLRCTGMGK